MDVLEVVGSGHRSRQRLAVGAVGADADHCDVGAQRRAVVIVFQVLLQLADERVLQVQDAPADLADRMLVVFAGWFVASGTAATSSLWGRRRVLTVTPFLSRDYCLSILSYNVLRMLRN